MYNLPQNLLAWDIVAYMVVRIQFGAGSKIRRNRGTNRHVALAFAALLTPAALLAALLALWRIASDLNWTAQFAIPSGLFSHWQVWIATAVVLQLCAHLLNRYGRGANTAES
jgi:hypothetical protein